MSAAVITEASQWAAFSSALCRIVRLRSDWVDRRKHTIMVSDLRREFTRVEDTLGHTLTPAASGMCQLTRFIPGQSDAL